jgi:hypothetical protein
MGAGAVSTARTEALIAPYLDYRPPFRVIVQIVDVNHAPVVWAWKHSAREAGGIVVLKQRPYSGTNNHIWILVSSVYIAGLVGSRKVNFFE